ncbi:Hypothetical Protein OBI_RACECAR_38 [Arthrobacter phage Racecar]|nr:hypothetical protein PBI_RACECAR_119 [Arthrobacter phage Racecar]
MSQNTSTGTVLTGAGIDFFFKRRIISAFEIEARGMKMNRGPSALQQVKMLGLVPENSRSKKNGLKAIVAHIKELDPNYEPSENVKKLMA